MFVVVAFTVQMMVDAAGAAGTAVVVAVEVVAVVVVGIVEPCGGCHCGSQYVGCSICCVDCGSGC